MAIIDPFPGNCSGHYGHLLSFYETLPRSNPRDMRAVTTIVQPAQHITVFSGIRGCGSRSIAGSLAGKLIN